MMAEKYDEDSQNQTLKKGQDFNALILEQQQLQQQDKLKTIDEKKLKEDSIVVMEEAKHSLPQPTSSGVQLAANIAMQCENSTISSFQNHMDVKIVKVNPEDQEN